MRPLLFLDVDGVVNCLGYKGPADQVAAIRHGLIIPAGMRERIQILREHFDPVWATAWREAAHEAFAPYLDLGAEPWPFVPWRIMKLPHVIDHAGSRPWAFVDDDIDYELREARTTRSVVAGLLVQPDPRVGLTDGDVFNLVTWADALKERAA